MATDREEPGIARLVRKAVRNGKTLMLQAFADEPSTRARPSFVTKMLSYLTAITSHGSRGDARVSHRKIRTYRSYGPNAEMGASDDGVRRRQMRPVTGPRPLARPAGPRRCAGRPRPRPRRGRPSPRRR